MHHTMLDSRVLPTHPPTSCQSASQRAVTPKSLVWVELVEQGTQTGSEEQCRLLAPALQELDWLEIRRANPPQNRPPMAEKITQTNEEQEEEEEQTYGFTESAFHLPSLIGQNDSLLALLKNISDPIWQSWRKSCTGLFDEHSQLSPHQRDD